MTTHLYISPAASGKTKFAGQRARIAARNLASTPRVCIATSLQARAFKRQLAEMGGAIGVRVITFDGLYAECLQAAREAYTQLDDPVWFRLIRAIVDQIDLQHYAPIKARPGFIQCLQDVFAELKAEQVLPEQLRAAIIVQGDEPRVRELIAIYAAYQNRLQTERWADRAGLGWLAVEAIKDHAPDVAHDWSFLIVDGFDNFTRVQIELLRALAGRVGELIITLTESLDHPRAQVHERFDKTRARLQSALAVTAEPLPANESHHAPALAHLEANVYADGSAHVEPASNIEMCAPSDRAAEVRAALRWIKQQLVQENTRAHEVALIARQIDPYRPFITQIAREFGLPIRIARGSPLRKNPAIVALIDLLRARVSDETGAPALPRRLIVEAWRSPYLNWDFTDGDPVGIVAGDADALDIAARWGRVIGGAAQWRDALTRLAQIVPNELRDEDARLPANVPIGDAARALHEKFDRFVARITPPATAARFLDFTRWLETMIGLDPDLASLDHPQTEEPTSLRVVACARANSETQENDIAALRALKDVLRGLVWAEQAIAPDAAIDYARFFQELVGAIDATTYTLPLDPARAEIIVADAIQARGLAFRAVAILGLAEGEFPATISEDPFLRDADRRVLQNAGLPIDLSTTSAEAEFFYETITRAREKLFLTRPRLADNGAEWQASPFWDEILRLVNITPGKPTHESVIAPDQVASSAELMIALATRPDLRASIAPDYADRVAALEHAG